MSLTSRERSELDDLLDRLVVEALDDSERSRLNALVCSSDEAQRIYFDYLTVHAAIVFRASLQSTAEMLGAIVRGDDGNELASERSLSIDAVDPSTDHPHPELAEESTVPSRRSEAVSPGRVAPAKSPVLGTVGGIFRNIANSPLVATLLVAVVLYGAFGFLAWNLRSGKLPSRIDGNDFAVAIVCDTSAVRWSKETKPRAEDSPIHPGEPLKIDSGMIELELKAGAKLLVEGPADWSVDGENAMTLNRGRLVVQVPYRATGFRLITPTAIVVDLGTEFAVEIDERGATEVQVLKGKIELHLNVKHRDSSSAPQLITLIAGEARRIEPSGENGDVIVRNIVAMPERFTARLSSAFSAGVPQIRVEGARASSSYPAPELDVNHLIRGDGLKGDRHSAQFLGTMWHTDYNHVKNEFVLFDLFRSYRLRSMKVWNFNDAGGGRFAWIGVKRADIYVSSSGSGDPLSQPAEWKLVVADQQFAPGTGKDDYATPTVVSLGDVEGRYAAIVIKEALDSTPRDWDPTPDTVGLSEVQFFGSRVESPKSQSKR